MYSSTTVDDTFEYTTDSQSTIQNIRAESSSVTDNGPE